MENKKNIITAVVFVIIGLVAGYFIGQQTGQSAAEKKFSPLVELAFPKPADEMQSLTGTVKAVVGATITLEINDPADYLPHLDNSPRTTQIRYASITPDTKYVAVSNGSVVNKPFSLSNIKTGDTITVRSNANIKDTQRFDASEVDLVK